MYGFTPAAARQTVKNSAVRGFTPRQGQSGAAGFKSSGPVRGPGTGTSDSIETEVPQGTFIMPTDSTKAIGEQALEGLGKANVPVNLSNGEFKLPPEQVHAVGVQALEQMKGATHTPVPEPRGFKPQMFFANGGVVDYENKRLLAQTYTDGAMLNERERQTAAPAAPTQSDQSPVGVKPAASQAAQMAVPGGGRGLRPTTSSLDAAPQASQASATPRASVLHARSTAPQLAPPGTPAAQTASPTAATAPGQIPSDPSFNALRATLKPGLSGGLPAGGGPLPAAPNGPNNVTRVGNSYSGQDITQGFTVNGRASGGGGQPSAQSQVAAQGLSDRYAAEAQANPGAQAVGFQPGGGGGGAIGINGTTLGGPASADKFRAQVAQSNAQTAIRDGLSSTNPRVRAAAMQAMTSLQGDASQLQGIGMREAGENQRTNVRDAGETGRTAMRETGDNQRAANTLDLAQQRLGMERTSTAIENRAKSQLSALQERVINAANPVERREAAASIAAVQGRELTGAGQAPSGYAFNSDGSMRAIPGGPADLKQQGALNQDTQSLTGSIGSFDRLGEAANAVLQHPGLAGITGLRGKFPNVPGSNAANAQALLETLKSQVGFGVLQDMRNNSKTGGALGAISDAEGKRLESNLAALDKAQSLDQFKASLSSIMKYSEGAKDRVREAYNLKHPGAENLTKPNIQSPPAPQAGLVQEGWRFKGGNPADKANWEKLQ